MKLLYSTQTHAVAGRHGKSYSQDGRLNVTLSHPVIQPRPATGTDPEQLFGCAYAACYGGACEYGAKLLGIDLVTPVEVTSVVQLLKRDDDGFAIGVELTLIVTGVSEEQAQTIADKGHTICPYSHATRGNINVTTQVVVRPTMA
jgi:lipoyl-dependent peroxiredoxin